MDREQLIRRALERLGSEALQRLRVNLSKDRTRASNNLHDSMYYNIVGSSIEIFMSSYAMTIDEGRRAYARVPKGFAKDIEKWMGVKGISQKRGKTTMQ